MSRELDQSPDLRLGADAVATVTQLFATPANYPQQFMPIGPRAIPEVPLEAPLSLLEIPSVTSATNVVR